MMRADSRTEDAMALTIGYALSEPPAAAQGDFEARRDAEIADSPATIEGNDIDVASAFHESAHAVIAIDLGGTLTQCRMTTSSGGRVVYVGIESTVDRIAVSLAGPVGHSLFTGEPMSEIASGVASWDFYTARCLFQQLPEDYRDAGFRAHLGHRARVLVQKRWKAISSVAASLMVHRSLTDAEVRAHL